jgi:hypothetical protein
VISHVERIKCDDGLLMECPPARRRRVNQVCRAWTFFVGSTRPSIVRDDAAPFGHPRKLRYSVRSFRPQQSHCVCPDRIAAWVRLCQSLFGRHRRLVFEPLPATAFQIGSRLRHPAPLALAKSAILLVPARVLEGTNVDHRRARRPVLTIRPEPEPAPRTISPISLQRAVHVHTVFSLSNPGRGVIRPIR